MSVHKLRFFQYGTIAGQKCFQIYGVLFSCQIKEVNDDISLCGKYSGRKSLVKSKRFEHIVSILGIRYFLSITT